LKINIRYIYSGLNIYYGAPTQKKLKEFGGQFGGKMKLEDTPPRHYGRPPNFGGYFFEWQIGDLRIFRRGCLAKNLEVSLKKYPPKFGGLP
jgi:hypothetical protein